MLRKNIGGKMGFSRTREDQWKPLFPLPQTVIAMEELHSWLEANVVPDGKALKVFLLLQPMHACTFSLSLVLLANLLTPIPGYSLPCTMTFSSVHPPLLCDICPCGLHILQLQH